MSRLPKIQTAVITIICSLLLTISWIDAQANDARLVFQRAFATGAEVRGNSVIQDKLGFIWIATQNGLARYDGYGLKWFKKTSDPNSVSYNQSNAILEGSDGSIWLGTFGDGLNRYDPNTGGFVRYGYEAGNPNSLGNNQIWALAESGDGDIWVGTAAGVSLFHRETQTFTNYQHDPNNPNSLSGKHTRALYEDRSGTLWVGTYGAGLVSLDSKREKYTRYLHDPNNPSSLGHNSVRSLFEDSAGVLWVATIGGGLNKLDRESGQFTRYQHRADNPTSISSNDVRQILEDSSGRLWVVSGLSGISVFDRANGHFRNYSHEAGNSESIGFNNVYNILEDSSGIMFFFSVSGRVDKFDQRSRRFSIYKNNPLNPNSLSTNSILHIYEDSAGSMWFGGFKEGGLNRLDRNTGKVIRYASNSSDPARLKYSYPTEFIEDSLGNFWVSTSNVSTATLSLFDRATGTVLKQYEYDASDPNSHPKSLFNFAMINDRDDPNILWLGTYGSGLVKFEKKEQRFTKYMKDPGNPNSISDNIVYDLYVDASGVMWVGTQTGGLCSFDKETKLFNCFIHNPADEESIGKGFVTEIREDSSGELWVVTYGSGLNRFDRATKRFQHFTEENGFATNQVQSGPLEDGSGKLWMSTDIGIIKFDPITGVVEKRYNKSDGLQGDVFQYFSSFKSSSGEMWFAGVNGVNSFFPKNVSDNPYIPPVYLTALTQGGVKMELGVALPQLKHVELDWRSNFFEFEFAALNYTLPEKNQYKYILEGLDKEWFNSGTRRFGRYANIPGGSYTLRVRAANNDGLWGGPEQEVAVNITVGSPFWNTWWFYLLLVAVLVMVVGFTILYLIRLKTEISQRKLAETGLHEITDRLQKVAARVPGMMYQFQRSPDGNYRFLYVSEAIHDICRITPEAALEDASKVFAVIHPDDRESVIDSIKESADMLRPWRQEYRVCFEDDEVRWLFGNSNPETAPDGGVLWHGFVTDITEQRQAEETLRRAHKMEAIGQLTGGIAHDFNNILSIILGNLSILERTIVDEDAVKRIKSADKAAQRAADLTKQLLGFSSKQAHKTTLVNINQMIEGMDSLISHSITPDVVIEHSLENDVWLTEIDPGDFEDALLNMVFNARDAMPKGGRLIIETCNKVLDTAYAARNPTAVPGEYVELAINDSGAGISKEHLDRVFEPFFSTKPQGKGTGLGLSMVFGFMQRSKGHIRIYSEPGIGTTIRCYLPRSSETTTGSSYTAIGKDQLPRGAETILVVDDEEDLIELARRYLEELGYTVVIASNGLQALDVLASRPGIDLLFSDVVMPGGMNGYELAEQAVANYPGIKVLLTSGYTEKAVAHNGQARFTANLLSKPHTQAELAYMVRKVLDGPGPAEASS